METKIICDCGYASCDITTFSVNNKEVKACPKCYNDYLKGALANAKTSEATANIPCVIGSCFCGKPAVIRAFDTNFCQQHDDELTKSFEARMRMPDNDFEGGGGA